MIIIFVGGGDVIVWGKLPSFTGWLTSPYRRVTFPHNLHHADVWGVVKGTFGTFGTAKSLALDEILG